MTTTSLKILVTGATGQQGGAVVRHLRRGHRVKALTRDSGKPESQALVALGVEAVVGDFGDRVAVERAMEGMDGVFVVTNFWDGMSQGKPLGAEGEARQGKLLADVAKAARIRHVIFSSASTGYAWPSRVPHVKSKQEIERHMRAIELPVTILRPSFFMDNFNAPYMDFGPKARDGRIEIPLRTYQRLDMISVEDIGAFAALAFERPAEFVGTSFDLAGDSLTPAQIAATFSRVTGREVRSALDERAIPEIGKTMPEFAATWAAFDELGGDAFIPGLRALRPELEDFDSFLCRTGWATRTE